MKLLLILRSIIPFMSMAAAYLKAVDENTTGADDKAAKALEVAIAALQELLRGDPAVASKAKAEGLL